MAKLTMLELEHLEEKRIFGKIVTIGELMKLSNPPLASGTIHNAILRGQLTCCKKGGHESKGGVWLIYLPSAVNRWKNRFLNLPKERGCND